HAHRGISGAPLTRSVRFRAHWAIPDTPRGHGGPNCGIVFSGSRHFLDRKAYADKPLRELGRVYVEVRHKIAEESAGLVIAKHVLPEEDIDDLKTPTMEECRKETAKLHAGDADNEGLWKEFMPHG